jgi:peptidase E
MRLDYTVAYVDIETQGSKVLLSYDLVEILGGNPFYLLNQMRALHTEDIFRNISERKILIGISAGSVVLQKDIELIAQYSPEMNDGVHLSDLRALALTDMEILPHYHRFVSRFDRFEERAQEYERLHNCRVIRLDDGEGVFISKSDEPMIISPQ